MTMNTKETAEKKSDYTYCYIDESIKRGITEKINLLKTHTEVEICLHTKTSIWSKSSLNTVISVLMHASYILQL